jgi:hypothetical protein
MKAFLVVMTLALGCARAPTRVDLTAIADGEWHVLDTSERGALVEQARPADQRSGGRGAITTPLALLADTLVPVAAGIISLRVGEDTVSFVRIDDGRFYWSVTPQLRLIRSPTDPQVYAFEYRNAIWLFEAPDTVRKLTLDAGLDSLLPKQREGEVILYWTADPVWSGDGEFIAFLTNRNAVRSGTSGQGMWTIHVDSVTERALFDVPEISVHTDGVFGTEFVFSSNRAPGVATVDPRSNKVWRRSGGFLLASERHGNAMLVHENDKLLLFRSKNLPGPDEGTLAAAVADMLLPPPAGMSWGTSASISPSGERVAIFASDDGLTFQLHILGPELTGNVYADLPGPPSYGPVWINERDVVFAAAPMGGSLKTYRARLR